MKTSDEKTNKKTLEFSIKFIGTHGPWVQLFNRDRVTRQKKSGEKMHKKALRLKLLELCKTKTKNSSPNMLNFFVILTDHDMVTDAGRPTKFRRKFNDSWLQTKCTKIEGPFETMGFNGKKTVWRLQTKKKENNNFKLSKNASVTSGPKGHEWNFVFVHSRN